MALHPLQAVSQRAVQQQSALTAQRWVAQQRTAQTPQQPLALQLQAVQQLVALALQAMLSSRQMEQPGPRQPDFLSAHQQPCRAQHPAQQWHKPRRGLAPLRCCCQAVGLPQQGQPRRVQAAVPWACEP